ncbi:MAG: four helix bundle protein [Clostridia bacterium]|nr:four helix bundle protein [Clostridia bacterium]
MQEQTIRELSVELTVAITEMCENITGKSVFKNQLLRSCSSIGANVSEAKYAQSRADFINKMEIALKECHETDYWIEILYRVHAITEEQDKALSKTCGNIRRKLIASITTAKKNEFEGDIN